MTNTKRAVLATTLPVVLAATTPTARWGHQAVYVPSQKAMYVVGGEVVSSGTQVTNDVLVLYLNQTSPSFSSGPSNSLPPHAFAAATLSKDGESLIVAGGITTSCSTDSKTHTLDLSSSSATWSSANPSSFVRRRGAGAFYEDSGNIAVVGGVADKYSCASGTYTYPAVDTLALPLSSSSSVSSASLPTSLTGSELAVSDFALARASDGTVYLVGGESSDGDYVSLSTIGKWTSSEGWKSQATTGDVPAGRVGATLVAHPTLDVLVLHGGEVDSSSTSTVALLNTTSWEWSAPSGLQSSSAISYHSSVVTSEGVLISAFGLGKSSTPSSSVNYLDMRSSSTSAWEWKSSWSTDMLSSTSTSSSASGQSATASSTSGSSTDTVAAADSSSSRSSNSNSVKIAVPIVLIFAVFLPLVFWLCRRRIQNNKKRREAAQFSFATQEDSGNFRGFSSWNNNSRKTRTQYPFGSDANEKEGGVFQEAIAVIRRMSRRRRLSGESESIAEERQMAEEQDAQVRRFDEKNMRWEEIDFGLGELDKRASQASTSSRDANVGSDPFADPVEGQLIDVSEESQPEMSQIPRRPTIVAVPSSSATNGQVIQSAPGFNPSSTDGLDWQLLADGMQNKPAFRSIAPTATLRSHAHSSVSAPVPQIPMPVPVKTNDGPAPGSVARSSGPPRLPSLDFERGSGGLAMASATSPQRSSDPTPRSVSQPTGPRQLVARVIPRVQPPRLEGMTSMQSEPKPEVLATRRASNPSPPAGPKSITSRRSLSKGSPVSMSNGNMMGLRVTNMTEDDMTTEESFGQAL